MSWTGQDGPGLMSYSFYFIPIWNLFAWWTENYFHLLVTRNLLRPPPNTPNTMVWREVRNPIERWIVSTPFPRTLSLSLFSMHKHIIHQYLSSYWVLDVWIGRQQSLSGPTRCTYPETFKRKLAFVLPELLLALGKARRQCTCFWSCKPTCSSSKRPLAYFC